MAVMTKRNPDAPIPNSDARLSQEQAGASGRSAIMSPEELAAAKERVQSIKIVDGRALQAAREKARVELGASAEQGRKGGWDGRTRAEIKKIRMENNLGEFSTTYDISIANLAQVQLARLDQELDRLRAQGKGEGDQKWQAVTQEREKYQQMLEATPPEARPTALDSQLEEEARRAWNEFNQESDKNKATGAGRIFGFLLGPKGDSAEVKAARSAWESAKAKKDQHEAEKILRLVQAMDIPSNNNQDLKSGQEIGDWRVVYITDRRGGLGTDSKVVLQKGEGQDRKLIIRSPEQTKRLAIREKHLASHPDQRQPSDL